MYNRGSNRELQEAITAGEQALNSLDRASEQLDGARRWGFVDLFGGGFITDMIKHSRLQNASAYLEDARRQLLVFQRELRDVRVPVDLGIDIGDFLIFADFFFDGVITDYLVQSRIADTRAQVANARSRVYQLLLELRQIDEQEKGEW